MYVTNPNAYTPGYGLHRPGGKAGAAREETFIAVGQVFIQLRLNKKLKTLFTLVQKKKTQVFSKAWLLGIAPRVERRKHSLGTQGSFIAVYMFENFHPTFNFKSKVSGDVYKNKNDCQLISTFSSRILPRCLMSSSTVHVISIFNVLIDLWFFLHKSHYMSSSNRSCQLMCIYFNFANFCTSNVKKFD